MWRVVAWLVVSCGLAGATHNATANDDDNSTAFVLSSSPPPPPWPGTATGRPKRTCEEANIRCALRGGCGMALQNYMLGCSDLMAGRIDYCDDYCKTALIALTSTEEGKDLMDCTCSDEYCRVTKGRVEVCRGAVVLASGAASVSCSVAHWICAADTLCSTAITYYDRLCRRMFIGNRCTARCNNSIAVLQRQEKAAKLESCVCDGSEPFDCQGIKRNMARLCFHEFDENEVERVEEETNEVDTYSKARLNTATTRGAAPWLALLAAAVVRWR